MDIVRTPELRGEGELKTALKYILPVCYKVNKFRGCNVQHGDCH